jgi:hypothetical protein
MSWSEDITQNFVYEQINFWDLWTLTMSGLNYMSGKMKDGYRKADNWEGGNNCLIFDIDNGLNGLECVRLLTDINIKALIVTTKSHKKEKNGIVCHRYRVIIPMQSEFSGTKEEYSEYYIEASKILDSKNDMQTKDVSRFYYSNPDQKYAYIRGEDIPDWNWFTPKKKEIKPVKKYEYNNSTKDLTNLENYFRQEAIEGQRNNIIYRYIQVLKDNNTPNIDSIIRTFNSNLHKPLPESEINLLLRNI